MYNMQGRCRSSSTFFDGCPVVLADSSGSCVRNVVSNDDDESDLGVCV